MPKEVWLTVLGGFLSGVTGVTLFFIQRWKGKRDEQREILFRIYQLMMGPRGILEGEGRDRFFESIQRLREIKSLAFLIKNKELARDIYLYAVPPSRINAEELQRRILGRFNKKLYQELARTKPGADQSVGPEPEKK